MSEALIGFTGFVGGNLRRQHGFDDLYNSGNIERIRGRSFDFIACAGAPAEKWRANKEPEKDRAALERLMDPLREVRARHFLLISTVDVYPSPVEVDEDDPVEIVEASPYGAHRRMLELFVRDRFECTILRLPGLFGRGLKKNVIYDLLHDKLLDQISPQSCFQFYDLENLWADSKEARRHGIGLLNLATEPVTVSEVARGAFGRELVNPQAPEPARYDFRSKYDELWDGANGYLYDKAQVLGAMKVFVERELSALSGREA